MADNSTREIFPDRLKHYMALRKKTRNDLVRDLGFKYTTVRDWEIGKTIPRPDKMDVLAAYLNCSSSDLLETKKEPITEDELSDIKKELLEIVANMSEAEAAVMLASLSYALGKQ